MEKGPPARYRFETRYRPDATLAGQLEFTFKYEGVNLDILDALFEVTGQVEIEAWLKRSPSSACARRIGFLYEWLTGEELKLEGPPNDRYIELLDPERYVVLEHPAREPRFRVLNNLPGTRAFCPLVRRTETIAAHERKNISEQARSLIESKSKRLIEREKPSQDKAERFVDLLSRASSMKTITEDPASTSRTWSSTSVGGRPRIASARTGSARFSASTGAASPSSRPRRATCKP